MKKKKTLKRLITLFMALVLSVSCLTISGSALEGSLDEFLKSRFTDKQIELIYLYNKEVSNQTKADLEKEFKNAKYEDVFENLMIDSLNYYGYHFPEGIVDVRANGALVKFTDAEPYIDENNRTMIPLRAAVEALGAEVAWDQATRTASVSKNGITVQVTIGSQELTIINNGQTSYETMDTVAVLNTEEGRTYVPIRYVAEALGAYVDYADAFRTVGIHCDVLTAEEIETLRAFPYTKPKGAIGYEEYMNPIYNNTEEDRLESYGPYRETFDNYANSREYFYRDRSGASDGTMYSSYNFNDQTGKIAPGTVAKFTELLIKEAEAELCWNSENLVISLRTDQSCIYHPDDMDGLMTTIRGIMTVTLNVHHFDLDDLEGQEAMRRGWFLFGEEKLDREPEHGVPTSYYVDIHMNTNRSGAVCINKMVVLGQVE